MSKMLAKHWIVGIIIGVIASFAVGALIGPAVMATSLPLPPNPEHVAEQQAIERLGKEISQISNELSQIKNKTSAKDVPEVTKDDISNLEKQIKVLGARLDNLDSLSGDIGELKQEINTLKAPLLARVLSEDIDKSEYMSGDSLAVSGIGLPNRSVKVSLLGSDKMVISESLTTSDSSGRFTFTVHLSKSLSEGTYTVKASQGITSIEKEFRIISIPIRSVEGLVLTSDSVTYPRGGTIVLSGITTPNTWVDLDVFDSNGMQILRTSTKSDTLGRYSLVYPIPTNAVLGNYEARAIVGDKQVSIKFSVVSTLVTITTDKIAYNRGDLVKITGKAAPNSKITITAEPPAGDTRMLTTTATDAGNYITLLSINNSPFTGTWKLTAKQGVSAATTQITVI